MAHPEMTPVTSSNLRSVGYDAAKKDLYVSFKSGGTYVYHGVPAETHQAMIGAPSSGSFLASSVKGHFPFERV